MSSRRAGWRIYNEQMSQLDYGYALWEPAPIHSFKRIQLGDVGYVRRGRFHLLFSAGCPLGERKIGTDVPTTFKPLDAGPVIYGQPRVPGCLCPNTVREIRAGLGASMCAVPMLEPGVRFSFELTEERGAALVTKYPTYREDVELESIFEAYTKRHYDSWVAFAREGGHGNDITPVLVTGVDMTRDFAMMAYSNNGVRLASEFTTSAPGIASASASAWGTWRTEGLVHTNCGPQLCCPPSSTQTMHPTFSGNNDTEAISDEYNQCVFIRYYTVRKRALLIPRVIKGAAGPHDLDPEGRDDEEMPLEAQSGPESDSGSDIVPSLSGGDGDRYSITDIDSESDTVIHNATADETDEFDVVADYVFRKSDAESVVIHHRDIALLREPGGSKSVSIQLFEKWLSITVDESGVGNIVHQTDPLVNARPRPVEYQDYLVPPAFASQFMPRPIAAPSRILPTFDGPIPGPHSGSPPYTPWYTPQFSNLLSRSGPGFPSRTPSPYFNQGSLTSPDASQGGSDKVTADPTSGLNLFPSPHQYLHARRTSPMQARMQEPGCLPDLSPIASTSRVAFRDSDRATSPGADSYLPNTPVNTIGGISEEEEIDKRRQLRREKQKAEKKGDRERAKAQLERVKKLLGLPLKTTTVQTLERVITFLGGNVPVRTNEPIGPLPRRTRSERAEQVLSTRREVSQLFDVIGKSMEYANETQPKRDLLYEVANVIERRLVTGTQPPGP